jgi:hypothetical protein
MSDLQERDHTLDYPHELYPPTYDVEDRSEVTPTRLPSGELVRAPASNVDDDGVAHFLLITPDPGEPDLCGGCKKEWPCEKRVGVEVLELPAPDPEEERLHAVAVTAAREALGLPPL